jgi:mono/diheme cytochrome c family protein
LRRGALRVDSLTPVARRNRKNPWTSTGEVLLWLLFVALIFPAAFAGYAVGHYTSLGKPPATVTTTVSVGGTVTQPTTTAATTTSATTTSSSGGDVAAGKSIFNTASPTPCSSCHTFTAAGASGSVGPNLDTAPATDAAADGNMALAAFIKQSIVDPSAYIATGYTDGIMPKTFGTSLTPAQIDDLVAFILSGTKQ